MKYINLNTLKSHLNMDSGFTADDTYLEMLWDVVLTTIEKHIDKSFSIYGTTIPSPLIQAGLLLAGTYYANREHVSYSGGVEVPDTYNYLISLYKDYSGDYAGITSNVIDEITEKMEEMQDEIDALKAGGAKQIYGDSPITVTTSGDTSTIGITDVNLGEY